MHLRLRAPSGLLLLSVAVALLAEILPTTATAATIRLDARYGGSSLSDEPTLESPAWEGWFGGMQFVAVDILGPEVIAHLQPRLGFAHHWAGRLDHSFLTGRTQVLSLGVARALAVGHAEVVLHASAAHVTDTYEVRLRDLVDREHEASRWGLATGFDLRFAFLDHLDALVGYEMLLRGDTDIVVTPDESYPYEIAGRSVDHCISAGLSIAIDL